MVMLDGTVDGGGDGFGLNEEDHSDDGQGPYDTDPFDRNEDFDYPQQEDYENDADNFESHQLSLDNENEMDNGDD